MRVFVCLSKELENNLFGCDNNKRNMFIVHWLKTHLFILYDIFPNN